jgi:tetratricopeptide (TPR) repeat protein
MTEPNPISDDPARELRQLVEAGRYREALDAHQRAEPAARPPELDLLAATAATRLGDFGTSVTLAESALEHFRARADSDGRMRAMNLLGAVAFEQGRLEDAERCFGEALELARVVEDTRMAANASNNLASVAHLRNRSDLALSLYRTALLAYQRLGDRRGTAQTYHNLGLTFRQQREWMDAEAAALQAVRHAEEVGEGGLMALAVMGRAEIHLDRAELDLARQELTRAEGCWQSGKGSSPSPSTSRSPPGRWPRSTGSCSCRLSAPAPPRLRSAGWAAVTRPTPGARRRLGSSSGWVRSS